MENIQKLRDESFALASESYVPTREPKYTKYSPIYIAPTSNIKDAMKLYKNYDRVLSVGGTGAFGYEALLHGAKKVDLFDVNDLQRIYFLYMLTSIKHLSYKDFIKHFTLKSQKPVMQRIEFKDLLSEELYQKVVYYLPEDVEKVLTPLYDFFDSVELLFSSLYRYEHIITLNFLKKVASFYSEEEYYKLQKILRENEDIITWKTVSLVDVPRVFKDENPYDLIILDNILQYYKNISEIDTPYKTNMLIDKKMSNLLSKDGSILVNYGFEVSTLAFKEFIGEKIELQPNATNIAQRIVLGIEQNVGVTCGLKKWDSYKYDFIPGVEGDNENVIITYKKGNR